jgi:hypothetical protein
MLHHDQPEAVARMVEQFIAPQGGDLAHDPAMHPTPYHPG